MFRAIVVPLGVLAIAACTPLTTATRSVSLGQGDVVATTPVGYCVDDVSSQPASDFAVLAPCTSLGADSVAPDVIGVATVQVGPAESGNAAADELALRDFLITDEGVSLLSQAGDASTVEILSSQAFNSQVMVHFTDSSPPPLAGLQNEEWRAFTNVNGRLVTIGVRGLAVAPLGDGPGATLLKLILAGVQAATTDTETSQPEV
ncbi:dihydroxy-acid dehydratase [Yoonia sp. GPGPB17]|uniref:dihydroxy-acid dehydratase n=1 Tax=Yoonia sp. GPGPB17 TaxID=3026147 RepID=UPI0030BDD9B0